MGSRRLLRTRLVRPRQRAHRPQDAEHLPVLRPRAMQPGRGHHRQPAPARAQPLRRLPRRRAQIDAPRSKNGAHAASAPTATSPARSCARQPRGLDLPGRGGQQPAQVRIARRVLRVRAAASGRPRAAPRRSAPSSPRASPRATPSPRRADCRGRSPPPPAARRPRARHQVARGQQRVEERVVRVRVQRHEGDRPGDRPHPRRRAHGGATDGGARTPSSSRSCPRRARGPRVWRSSCTASASCSRQPCMAASAGYSGSSCARPPG